MTKNDPEYRKARVYDDVAEVYERVNAPRLFDEAARGLVEVLGPAPGARVLDAGCGTGAVSRAALAAVGGQARVVAMDPSLSMALAARRCGVSGVVLGSLPDLPFATATFDAALSGFVMSHVDDPDTAAREFARVVRPGGRVALSAWYPADDEVVREWNRVVHAFVPPERIEAGVREVMPADGRLSKPGAVARLLTDAGLAGVSEHDREVECVMTVDEYAASREICATGRLLRLVLSPPQFETLCAAVRDALSSRFSDPVRFTRRFHVGVGTVRP